LTKYIFRLAHLGPVIYISGKLLVAAGEPEIKYNYKNGNLFNYAVFIMLVGGLTNMFLLKPK
jgi:hypothetical protein